MKYCRTIITDEQIEPFVDGILGITDEDEKGKAINSIAAAERNRRGYDDEPTLTYKTYRDFRFKDDKKREELRQQIINELIDNQRIDNDDDISLGNGGAAPKTQILKEKKAFYIIGPPASGKSTIASKVADEFGAYILDADYAKRKLPEYNNQISSASLIHEESDALIFNYDSNNLLEYCMKNNYNIVIPKIGHKLEGICNFCSGLRDAGYDVFLISIDLDRIKSTRRAYKRFIETKRYVPLSLVFDGYSNQPTLNYFKIKQNAKYKSIFSGFAQVSTDVNIGEDYILLEQNNINLNSLVKR